MATIDQQFVEYIVKNLVSQPEDVKIDRTIDEKGVLLTLTVADEDLGRIIGRRGSTAQSLRALLRALGTKNDARYNLKIVNNESPAEEKPAPVETSTDETVETEDNFAENTRKALAELDDLDV
ncbi:MAG: KH domain-containing protein [Candidatus Sacchiramonaceae bacterium]|nr:KH domain-containing protein [Candidatus Saccharimonadaceae bacterium]